MIKKLLPYQIAVSAGIATYDGSILWALTALAGFGVWYWITFKLVRD
jgi:hypothetical protein